MAQSDCYKRHYCGFFETFFKNVSFKVLSWFALFMKLSLVKVRIVANESQKLTRQILKISRQPKMKNELQASFF